MEIGEDWINDFDASVFFKSAGFLLRKLLLEIIHLVRTQSLLKNWHFLPSDTHTYVCVLGVRTISFAEDFVYVLNE